MSRLLTADHDAFAAAFGHEMLEVEHGLVDEPLLTLSAIAELAAELPADRSHVEHHLGEVPAVVPGGSEAAPRLDASAADIVRSIETNSCRMALRHIEVVPRYRELMDRLLDDVAPAVAERDGGMYRRESFLFVNAPHSIVPFHADPEHNFLLQVRGTKTFRSGRFRDRRVLARDLERQYLGGDSYLTAMPDDTTDYPLRPGTGVYVPPSTPHLVENGDEASVSLSVTFYTPQADRGLALHRINGRLRRFGLRPRYPGDSDLGDRAKLFTRRQLLHLHPKRRRAAS